MRWGARFGLLLICISCYQSCGQFRAATNVVPYPYTSKTDFFYDLKLVSVERQSDGTEAFVFDLAVSYAANADQTVNYQVAYSTNNRSGVCRTESLSARAETKHHWLRCILPTPTDLYIQLTMVGPNGEREQLQYRF